jgi:hypothetical protein
MRVLTPLLLTLAIVGAAACDVRPLRSADLYGAAGAPPTAPGSGGSGAGAGRGGDAGGGGAGGAGGGLAGAGGLAGDGGPDAAGDGSGADAAVDQSDADGQDTSDGPGTPDGPPTGCAQTCSADQFCDELTNQCVPRTGPGMLSGTVTDACSRNGIDARIGIAGRRQCSAFGKGSYFFTGLPLGRLEIAAYKDGYELHAAPIEIVAGGVLHDIELVRIGGCQSTPPLSPCTCTEPSCTPMTP